MELLAPDQISEEETKMEAEWQSHSRYWPPPYPPGVRFTPTDEELVKYYLTPKVRRQKLPYDSFIEDDLYQYHPQELAGNIFCFPFRSCSLQNRKRKKEKNP